MAYRNRQRSREPPNVGQNVHVFTPLPSIHAQARQIQQTGIRPQFGINQNNSASPQQDQTPARQRARSHVRDVDPVDLTARNLAAPVPKTPRKRPAPMTDKILQDYRRRSRSREPHVRTRYEDDNVPGKRSRELRARSLEPCAAPAANRNPLQYTNDPSQGQSRKSRTPESDVIERPLRKITRSMEPQQQSNSRRSMEPSQGQQSSRRNSRSEEAQLISSIPTPQQPLSSSSTTNAQQPPSSIAEPADAPVARRSFMVNQHLSKEPCVATMVVKLYDPNESLNSKGVFVPNIFGSTAILENVNGENAINYLGDVIRKYCEKHC